MGSKFLLKVTFLVGAEIQPFLIVSSKDIACCGKLAILTPCRINLVPKLSISSKKIVGLRRSKSVIFFILQGHKGTRMPKATLEITCLQYAPGVSGH